MPSIYLSALSESTCLWCVRKSLPVQEDDMDSDGRELSEEEKGHNKKEKGDKLMMVIKNIYYHTRRKE